MHSRLSADSSPHPPEGGKGASGDGPAAGVISSMRPLSPALRFVIRWAPIAHWSRVDEREAVLGIAFTRGVPEHSARPTPALA